MTIHPHLMPSFDRLAEYYAPTMLVLGSHGSTVPEYPVARDYFARWAGDGYRDLDLDGGDLELDLNEDLGEIAGQFATVFNIGTIEHVWNAHNAWANALRAVAVGGHFLTHSPIEGYLNHGLHMTHAPAIRAFVAKNGFEIVQEFTTRPTQIGVVLWLAARKTRHIGALGRFAPAWQVYEDGRKKDVR